MSTATLNYSAGHRIRIGSKIRSCSTIGLLVSKELVGLGRAVTDLHAARRRAEALPGVDYAPLNPGSSFTGFTMTLRTGDGEMVGASSIAVGDGATPAIEIMGDLSRRKE